MYETFYGLNKRPFAAAADPCATVETPAVADVIERLDRCIRHGRGIGVLTAASGLGKTHLCHRLSHLWQSEFQVTLLPSAGFPSGRGLLQAILAELDQPYQGLRETELRIELTSVARAVRAQSSGLILLVDEAHRATERVFEEIRLIANLIDAGEPLVRIVLAGNLELEDKLADPDLAALNERVGELVTIPRLTADEARQYLRERAERAGRTLDDLFEPAAIELIVQACGGVPRSLNQLADHGLLLGSVAECKPVGALLVREALDDLKRLPLQWQDPLPAPSADSQDWADSSGWDDSSESNDALPENIIEICGLDDDGLGGDGLGDDFRDESGDFGAAAAIDAVERAETPVEFSTATCESTPPATEPLLDRFARLDAREARRRWLEELDRAEREPAAATANPVAVIDSIEAVVADELACDRPPVTSDRIPSDAAPRPVRAEDDGGGWSNSDHPGPEREPSIAPEVSSPVDSRQADAVRAGGSEPACATLFRDLRRRDLARGQP